MYTFTMYSVALLPSWFTRNGRIFFLTFSVWNALTELSFLYGFVLQFEWICVQLFQFIMEVNFYEFVDYLKQLCMSLVEMVLND